MNSSRMLGGLAWTLVFGLLLSGCAGERLRPEGEATIRYEPVYKNHDFPPRTTQPQIVSGTPAQQESKGVVHIGKLTASQVIEVCFDDGGCNTADRVEQTRARLLEAARNHGADEVIFLEDQRQSVRASSKEGKCISGTWVWKSNRSCNSSGHCSDNPIQVFQCVTYAKVHGKQTSITTVLDLWRRDPQIVHEKHFIAALKMNDLKSMRRTVDQGFDPRQPGILDVDYLNEALNQEKLEIAAYLLKQGLHANVYQLQYAIRYRNLNVIALLLKHGVDPNIGNPDLVYLAEKDDIEILNMLLKAGMDRRRLENKDVIHAATKAGSQRFLRMLK